MRKQIITSGSVLLLAFAANLPGTALAATTQSVPVTTLGTAGGGHEDIETLKAELAALNTKLSNTETGRQYLVTRLGEVLDDNAALKDSLAKAKKGRKYMSEKYLGIQAEARTQQSEHAAAIAKLEKDQARTSLALERALRGKAYVRGKLDESEKALARDSLALERALRGKAYLRGKLDDTEKTLARDSLALERALRGKAYLRGKLDDTEKNLARDSLALERALRGRAFLSGKLNDAKKTLASDFEKNNDTSWAENLSAELTESFGVQSDTEVVAQEDNSVAIKVGNTGLFRPGSTVLSDGGQALLNEIGRELVSRDNAHIRVIGHTDNIPTGSTSRFPSNEALSLARATSALSYLSSVGVPAERLAASGVADAYPIASNDTEAGRLANRRVEIVLTPAQ
jgi:flagellar motor protein MotB